MIAITCLIVTPFSQNCRILTQSGRKDAIVIDPGGEAIRILAELSNLGVRCQEIWLTHSHLDHCGGVAELLRATGATLVGHPVEEGLRQRIEETAEYFGLPSSGMENCPEPTVSLQGGETILFGDIPFEVIFSPGHSPGHLCFYQPDEKFILSGDVLFAGSIGRTDLPGGNSKILMQTLREKILPLPQDTRILSGHGPDTVLSIEAATNPFLDFSTMEKF